MTTEREGEGDMAVVTQGRDESDWVNFDLKVSVSLSPALAERFREHLFKELREIEADDPEVLALADNLPGLWARALDRQLSPFAAIYDVSGEDLWDEYRWFGEVMGTYVNEGWWHPDVKSGQVHLHPERPNGSWSITNHRSCEPVFTKRKTRST